VAFKLSDTEVSGSNPAQIFVVCPHFSVLSFPVQGKALRFAGPSPNNNSKGSSNAKFRMNFERKLNREYKVCSLKKGP
jgi:hypothetical protein